MSGFIQTFMDEVRTAVQTALPEMLPANGGGGVHYAEVAERIPMDTQIATYGIPYAIIHLPQISDAEWGGSNEAYEASTEIHIVIDGAEDVPGIIDVLTRMRDYIRGTGLPSATVLPGRRISWSPNLPTNTRAISKQIPVICGLCSFNATFGEGPI